MNTSNANIHALLSTLAHDDLILTVNRRLANYLRQEYDVLQQLNGREAWFSPTILPLHSWLQLQWESLDNDKLLLNDAQEILVWENLILTSSENQHLLNPSSVALHIKDSYFLIQNWSIDKATLEKYARTETFTFIKWIEDFETRCQKNNWLNFASLLRYVVDAFEQNLLCFPKRIILVGFDDFPPLIKKLIDLFKEKCEVLNWSPTTQNHSIVRVECLDVHQELITLARWAYQKLTENQLSTIACIIPNLTSLRDDVSRTFEDVFTSYSELQKKFIKPPYNISAAKSLSEYPLICSGLYILKLGCGEFKMDEFSYVLRSPFLGGAEKEMNKRFLLDANLRTYCEQYLNIKDLQHLMSSSKPKLVEFCQIWLKNFSAFYAYLEQLPAFATCLEWAHHLSKLLDLLGWPGERILDSNEFQQLERWRSLLNDFTSLDLVTTSISYKKALSYIQQLANRALFQSKTENLPIQILGTLESSGMIFDHLWVEGLDNETWPASASPNPFIPIELQRMVHMPHASAEREMIFSQALTQRFSNSAKEVIFSHASQEGDKPLSPSPLIQHITPSVVELPDYCAMNLHILKTSQIETLVDENAPPIPNDTFIRGGTTLFKSQAICPFKAFAEVRLNATPIDHPHFGLALHERGSLLHLIMAKIWQTIKTQDCLLTLSDEALNELIVNTIGEAFETIQPLKPMIVQKRFLAIEKQRLRKLIFNWLMYEKSRSPFSVIDCEFRMQTQLFGVEVHLQIDRIDQLMDGKYLILDYKTGKPSLLDWFGERPEEPQLPLYCVSNAHPIAGVAFAQLRTDNMLFKGITADKDVLPDVNTIDTLRMVSNNDFKLSEWSQLVEQWQKVLQNLAEQFRGGVAKVDPKDPVKSCQYCHLQELCRVHSELYTTTEKEI